MRWFLGILMGLMVMSTSAAADQMTAPEARAAALAGEVVLVDIRTPPEWAESGVPDAAHNLDMRSPGFVQGLKELMEANPGTPLAMICATGGRSSYVADALKAQGVPVIDVSEGMHGSGAGPGWLKHSLPVRAPGEPVVTQ